MNSYMMKNIKNIKAKKRKFLKINGLLWDKNLLYISHLIKLIIILNNYVNLLRNIRKIKNK
jgi:hypothetical protein